jgi:hypothetical protein
MKTFSGRDASQSPEELGAFIAMLKSRGVRSYLEIGARHGDTFHEIMINLPPGSMGVAVDLPGAAWGTSSSRYALENAIIDLRRRGYDVCRIFGDSRSTEVFLSVKNLGPFDAGLIDGDHRYVGVRADWISYGPLCGITAFHDIAGEGVRARTGGHPVEVPRLWKEIKAERDTVDFVAPGSVMGIGVVL